MLSRILFAATLLVVSAGFAVNSYAESCKRSNGNLKNIDFRVMFESGSGQEVWVNVPKKDVLISRFNDGKYFDLSLEFADNLKKINRKPAFKKTGIKRVFIISKKKFDRSVATIAQLSNKNDPFAKLAEKNTAKGKRLKLNFYVPKGKRKNLNRLLVATLHTCEKKNGKFVVAK